MPVSPEPQVQVRQRGEVDLSLQFGHIPHVVSPHWYQPDEGRQRPLFLIDFDELGDMLPSPTESNARDHHPYLVMEEIDSRLSICCIKRLQLKRFPRFVSDVPIALIVCAPKRLEAARK